MSGFRRALILLPALIVAVFVVSAAAIAWSGLRDEIRPADVALVLGSKVEANGRPSARLRARLDKALELRQRGLCLRLIVSGGTGREGFDEARVMKQYLVGKGVPREAVFVDSAGSNTYLSARNAARLMDKHHWRSAVVVSQYFHLARAALAVRRFGVSPGYHAHADFFEWRDIYSTAREVVGYCAYLGRTYRR